MEEEALALMVQNLRIKLSKAEAQLAALKEAQVTKQNAKVEGSVDDISTGRRSSDNHLRQTLEVWYIQKGRAQEQDRNRGSHRNS